MRNIKDKVVNLIFYQLSLNKKKQFLENNNKNFEVRYFAKCYSFKLEQNQVESLKTFDRNTSFLTRPDI